MLREVLVPRLRVAELEPVIGPGRYRQLLAEAAVFRQRLGSRTIWNVNSTAVGGGVAEMLRVLVAYTAGLQIAIRWTVISGDPDFFAITKGLHNQIHGQIGSTGPVGHGDARHYEQVLAANADELLGQVRPGDIALLHDPQTAGLAAPLAQAGVHVVWRCHIGVDRQTDVTRAAWDFLRPYLAAAHGYVFTRRQYVPSWIPGALTQIIPPSINPLSAKNQQLDPGTVQAILATIGVLDGGPPPAPGRFTRQDGTSADVTLAAMVTGEGRPGRPTRSSCRSRAGTGSRTWPVSCSASPSMWQARGDGYLMLVGPDVSKVSDDPEGGLVFAECLAQWQGLPAATRARVLLVNLPDDDVEQNAAAVNAIQRHAKVIAQKSRAEGFGLTVAEGMWKGRPVVGSAVGGILDQIVERHGLPPARPGRPG